MRIDLIKNNPMVLIKGYYDEEERAHIPESQRVVVDAAIAKGEPIRVEDLVYDKGRLTSVQILDPRPNAGYYPVILYVMDFIMEVYVDG